MNMRLRRAAKVPTVHPAPPPAPLEPAKGERWWIKFSNSLCLIDVEVTDITQGTVCLFEQHRPGVYGRPELLGHRYARSDVVFVERISPTEKNL